MKALFWACWIGACLLMRQIMYFSTIAWAYDWKEKAPDKEPILAFLGFIFAPLMLWKYTFFVKRVQVDSFYCKLYRNRVDIYPNPALPKGFALAPQQQQRERVGFLLGNATFFILRYALIAAAIGLIVYSGYQFVDYSQFGLQVAKRPTGFSSPAEEYFLFIFVQCIMLGLWCFAAMLPYLIAEWLTTYQKSLQPIQLLQMGDIITGDDRFDDAILLQGEEPLAFAILDQTMRKKLRDQVSSSHLHINDNCFSLYGSKSFSELTFSNDASANIRDRDKTLHICRDLLKKLHVSREEIPKRLQRNIKQDTCQPFRRKALRILMTHYPHSKEAQATLEYLSNGPQNSPLRTLAEAYLRGDALTQIGELTLFEEENKGDEGQLSLAVQQGGELSVGNDTKYKEDRPPKKKRKKKRKKKKRKS